MSTESFQKALSATGYLMPDGSSAPGLLRTGEDATWRLRSVLTDRRVGLNADAVFSAQNTPTIIFKDAGNATPDEARIHKWHEAAWNVGLAPLLWIITPTEIRLYDCYTARASEIGEQSGSIPLDVFPLDVADRLQALDSLCGRFATETGAFWSSPIGQNINRRHRVDRELLSEISALEMGLTRIIPSSPDVAQQSEAETAFAREFAQRLIGRCIFTLYLVDRGIAQRFLPPALSPDVAQMFSSIDTAFILFEWLREKFNGDLFPMDDPGAEHQRLGEAHLSLLREFIQGRSLVKSQHGQGRLFRFRYDAIPVDLISSIYQQFARSSAADQADTQGLHYTPVELVHMTLDPVFEGLPPTARVLDPACGSGAFLVESFRRLVWKNAQNKPASRTLIRDILNNRLFGLDINKSALGIAAFSLYLAALELDENPISDVADLKFDRLIGTTLFEVDTVHGDLPPQITARPFDAIVGNPPWTFVAHARKHSKRKAGDDENVRPRRSPDQEFLWVAARLAGDSGRIGMIMKATPFFARDQHAVNARQALLRKLKPAALVNLSALRKEELFPDATGPALLFFARCSLVEQGDRLLVGSIPWTPDFRRNGVFHVGPEEFRTLPLARVLQTPAMLKAWTFGTARDGWLIEKLERTLPTLDQVLTRAGILALKARGQGFQVEGDLNEPPKHYYDLKELTPSSYSPFRTDESRLVVFEHPTLHRPREASIFRGPLLVCPKASFRNAAEPGRYSATVIRRDMLYTESFYGISFANHDATWANIISAILNSSMAAFQFAFGGGGWGLERPTVEPKDLLSLRVPDLALGDSTLLESVIHAEQAASGDPNNPRLLEALDRAVFALYALERDEKVIVRDSVNRAKLFLFEGRAQRAVFIRPPSPEALTFYATETVSVVNAYLRARGKRHLEALVYPKQARGSLVNGGPLGITAVRFAIVTGAPSDQPIINQGDDAELNRVTALIRGQVNVHIPPYLSERRQLRIYDADDLFVLKPSEARYWTRTAGLNDADIILADHWLKQGTHAPIV